ncbi:hypothetical protein V6N13_130348 [Hibiscus sabdariffa]
MVNPLGAAREILLENDLSCNKDNKQSAIEEAKKRVLSLFNGSKAELDLGLLIDNSVIKILFTTKGRASKEKGKQPKIVINSLEKLMTTSENSESLPSSSNETLEISSFTFPVTPCQLCWFRRGISDLIEGEL